LIYETVQITIAPEQREEFIKVYKAAWKEAAFKGSHAGRIMRAMENPERVDIIIEWDSLADHRQHRGTEPQVKFLATVRAWQTAPSKIEHFEWEELDRADGIGLTA
jgi:heme-degrading monooxygenase HmoA